MINLVGGDFNFGGKKNKAFVTLVWTYLQINVRRPYLSKSSSCFLIAVMIFARKMSCLE